MPAEDASAGRAPTVPRRTSIRHSLNFASVGKAFADVMNKDAREVDKNAKKAFKESRRLSAINLKPAAPRASVGESKPATTLAGSSAPDSTTVIRKRVSASFQKPAGDGASSANPTDTGPSMPIPRTTSTLRARPTTQSSLPKYRPKSIASDVENMKKPSPPRAGTRKRVNVSEDETEDSKDSDKSRAPAEDKSSRPISPLPHRAALKANLTSTVNTAPPSPPKFKAKASPTPSKPSPSRPTKLVKTGPTSIPRPPSQSSTSTSFTPKTPQGVKNARSAKGKDSPASIRRQAAESPLLRHSRAASKSSALPTSTRNAKSSTKSRSTDDGSDEEDDVALLLAPVAGLGAPTPAMPRIDTMRSRQRAIPKTPSRSTTAPTRNGLLYVAPLPPDPDTPSSSHLRPSHASDRSAPRGSLLTWDQLAQEASRTLGEEDIQSMLADINAPFRSGASSPNPGSTLADIPESPCLSALNSPVGFGSSISQVMLPAVTPSPAVHKYHPSPSPNHAVDSATTTLLRLQLASLENVSQERLIEIQKLEKENHELKEEMEARDRNMERLSEQVGLLQEQVRVDHEARERKLEEQQAHTRSLESQLQRAQATRDYEIQTAIENVRKQMQAEHAAALEHQREARERMCAAKAASQQWNHVHSLAASELEMVQSDRQTLSVLLTQLDMLETNQLHNSDM